MERSIFNILEYGAVEGGETLCTRAIQAAIDAAAKEKGGRVEVPAGVFLSGSLRLRSGVELHLQQGAVLRCSLRAEDMIDFSKDFVDDNADTGWEGGCFLYACHEKDITVSGTGKFDGQGREVFFEEEPEGAPRECPLGVKGFRPRMSFLEDVENLVIRDVTFYDAAFWTLHLAGCKKVRIENIVIDNLKRGVNTDGIDPDSCKNVIIRGCRIKSGDDCIVLKSTAPMYEKYGDCSDILISNCILETCCSALKIGTETYGAVHDVVMSDCIVRDCIRGIGIWSRDGGEIHHIYVHHVIGNTRNFRDNTVRTGDLSTWWGEGEPVFISAVKRAGVDRIPGRIHHIYLDHLNMEGEAPLILAGSEASPIEHVRITDSEFVISRDGKTQQIFTDRDLSDLMKEDFGILWEGRLDERPSEAGRKDAKIPYVYLRNVSDVKFS
jgi:polygalacturonase